MGVRITIVSVILLTLLIATGNLIYSEITMQKPQNRDFTTPEISELSLQKTNTNQDLLEFVIEKEQDLAQKNKASPSDWIKESQIKVYEDKVVIEIENAQWARFTDTKSMDPFLDSSANAIQIVPKNHEQIKVGDIVSFETQYTTGTVIHRIIEKGKDEQGVYFKTKGDNNEKADPGIIRFENIKRVLIAIIY